MTVRSRLVALGALATVLATAGLILGLASGEHCFEPSPSDLSLSRMAHVKRAVDAHSREPTEPLLLDGAEATFLLADYLAYPIDLEAQGTQLRAEIAAPALGTCFNIHYIGGITVDPAGTHLEPSQVRIGYIDVSLLARLRQWRVPDWLPLSPHAARLMAATRSLEVRDGVLVLHIDDPWSLK